MIIFIVAFQQHLRIFCCLYCWDRRRGVEVFLLREAGAGENDREGGAAGRVGRIGGDGVDGGGVDGVGGGVGESDGHCGGREGTSRGRKISIMLSSFLTRVRERTKSRTPPRVLLRQKYLFSSISKILKPAICLSFTNSRNACWSSLPRRWQD